MYCSKCGTDLDQNSSFCSSCGAPIEVLNNQVNTFNNVSINQNMNNVKINHSKKVIFIIVGCFLVLLLILIIIFSISTLNMFRFSESSGKANFVSDAKVFVSKARYMYNSEEFSSSFNNSEILLKDILGVNDYRDPFGGYYDVNNSFVSFKEDGAYITLISCVKDDSNARFNFGTCTSNSKGYHNICNVRESELDSSSVKDSVLKSCDR